jgi:hypothetical protein
LPSSCLPIGIAHWPVSRRRCSSARPASSTARTPHAGTRLFGFGAAGSFQYSTRPLRPPRRTRVSLTPIPSGNFRPAGRADRATGVGARGMPSVPLVVAIRHRQPDVRCYGLASAAK